MFRDRQGFMQGMNMYVPGMQWAATLNMNAGSVITLGRPLAPGAGMTINMPVGGPGYLGSPLVLSDTPYGRNIVVGVTTAPTGSTSIRVFGEDYLGQPMVEDFALAGGTGKKPFYRVLGARGMPTDTTAGAAITVTRGANLSLPFKGSIEWAKEGGTFIDFQFAKWIAPDQTDPPTGNSGDPRGMYIPTGTPDGIKEFIVSIRGDTSVNANNNGGLHGIRMYNG
jgi:hypothetical protein